MDLRTIDMQANFEASAALRIGSDGRTEATSNSTRGGGVCANIAAEASALRMLMRIAFIL
jgi:hypothetical protein